MAKIKDQGHEDTEKALKDLEKKIAAEYKKAEEETAEKLNKYLKSYSKKKDEKLKQLNEGKITYKEYEQWYIGQVAMGTRWKELKTNLAQDYTNASQIAKSTTYGTMPWVYATNHDYGTFQIEKGSGLDTGYTLYSRESAEALFRGGKFYPSPGKALTDKINKGEVQAWNEQNIQSALIQGVLQGEGAKDLTKRLLKEGGSFTASDIKNTDGMTAKQIAAAVAKKNRNASIRNARTMTTCVQNAGRNDAYKRAESMGIETEKEWLAVMDNKTRHEHRLLDGQHVPVNEKFKVEGNEIEYPGDPEAEPFLIYNCRCTMMPRLKRFDKTSNQEAIHKGNSALGDMTYEEWKYGHSNYKNNDD